MLMDGTMMSHPLSTRMIFDRGERLFPASTIAGFDGEALSPVTYAEVARRARQLAAALAGLGLSHGDPVGTFCWNTREHLEAYLAVPAMGFVLHTLNVRLTAEQLEYIIDHGGDRALVVDCDLLALLAPILPRLPRIAHVIVYGGGLAEVPGFAGTIHDYETLIAAHAPVATWPQLPETEAAAMCYTSGTTGLPKGVVYTHRSIFLHSLASMAADAFAISERDRILMVPAMFHANAWGMPYSGWLAGSDMILPGKFLQPDRLARAIALGRPSLMAAVPTILNDLLLAHARSPLDLGCFRSIIAGGSAVAPALIQRVKAAWGVDVVQGWGMTETSPMCVLSFPPRGAEGDEALAWRAKSGRPVPGMEVRIVDDADQRLAEDGVAVGHLQLRGPWVAGGYYRERAEDSPLTADGWLRTGDVGSIDPRGYVQITDRTKDLIKSGGEWISSVDLESALMHVPGIAEVAVVAMPDPRWEERPLAVVTMAPGHEPDFAAMRSHLLRGFARFMIPEYWAAVPSIPKTSVGKIDKKAIRSQLAEQQLPVVVETGFDPGDQD